MEDSKQKLYFRSSSLAAPPNIDTHSVEAEKHSSGKADGTTAEISVPASTGPHRFPFGFYVLEEKGYTVENKWWKLNENSTQKEGLLNKIYLREIY